MAFIGLAGTAFVLPTQTPHCISSVAPNGINSVARSAPASMGLFDDLAKGVGDFLQEVDNFVDDAAGRRLGNGAAFYGKRKSSFYGEDDAMRKEDPNIANDEEDFRGAPGGASFYYLSQEKDEQGRPMKLLTRKQAKEEKARLQLESEGLLGDFAAQVQPSAAVADDASPDD